MADDSGTSVAARRPLLLRLLLPSIGDLIFVALLATLLCTPLSVKLLGDAGIGWHVRTGQIIAATHSVPRVDPFSSIMNGHPWFAWEWLYDLAVGQLERVAGLNGVVWLTAVTMAVVFSWTFRLLLKRGVSLCLALGLLLLAASASMIHFLARPHVFSWLFTLAWFWILDKTELGALAGNRTRMLTKKTDALLWLLPPLMLLWVNIHGGFLVGFALLGIYWASAAITWVSSRQSSWEDAMTMLRAGRRTKKLLLVGVCTALATFGNPNGWRLYSHIYQYLSNRFLIDHIDEFQSPNFHHLAERCFAVLMLLAVIALAAKRRALRISEGLVVLFSVYAGLYAVRNVPVSSLLLALIAGPLLAESMQQLNDYFRRRMRRIPKPIRTAGEQPSDKPASGFLARMKDIELSLAGHLWPILATVAALCVALNGGSLRSTRLMDAHFDGRRFPVEAVNHLEESKHWGPILAPDYWGGYLIYRLYPKTQVVMDDRHDLYGENVLRDYLKMIHVERGWEYFLLEHNVCCVLVPQGGALANILDQSSDWKQIYRDKVAIAFDRAASTEPKNAK